MTATRKVEENGKVITKQETYDLGLYFEQQKPQEEVANENGTVDNISNNENKDTNTINNENTQDSNEITNNIIVNTVQ